MECRQYTPTSVYSSAQDGKPSAHFPYLRTFLPRVAHAIQARFHLRLGADILRLVKAAVRQRLGQTIHGHGLLLVIVRVLVAAAVAEVLHQARGSVADV